jgi:hypothetical protein
MLNATSAANLYEKLIERYGEIVEVRTLDTSTSPPTWNLVGQARAWVTAPSSIRTGLEQVAGELDAKFVNIVLLQADIGTYQVREKADRVFVRGKSYVPDYVNPITRSVNGQTIAVEIRCGV